MSGVNFNNTDNKALSNVFIQCNNGTDTSTNINNASWAAIPMFTAIDSNSNYTSEFTKNSNTQLQFNFDGWVMASASIETVSSGQRVSIVSRFYLNGVQLTATGSRTYIRGLDGALEDSTMLLPYIFSVSDGDTFEIRTQIAADSTATTTFLNNNGSNVTIARFG